jgi:small subunit ribosomal protein S21
LQVFVRDHNVDRALRILKRKLQREGIFREMGLRRFYENPSTRNARERTEAIRRARKLARRQAIPLNRRKAQGTKRSCAGSARRFWIGRLDTESRGRGMMLCIFRSETKTESRTLCSDVAGLKLPERFRPWRAIGFVRQDRAPPHNFPHAEIERSIETQGFQLWCQKEA